MKRIISIGLAICLAFSLVVTAFAATPTMNVSVDKNSIEAGGDVKVTLTLSDNLDDVTSVGFNLFFDSDLFTLKSSTETTLKPASVVKNNADGSYYAASFVSTTGVGQTLKKGVACTFVFTAKSDVTADVEASFTVKFEKGTNSSFAPISCATGDAATVTVKKPTVAATKVTLDKTTLSLEEGASAQLTATVTPANSTDTVTWQSSDTKVATVDENGNVTAVAAGKATITATAGSKKATCAVTVTEKACEHTNIVKGAEAKDATCSEAGNVEYWVCNDCGKKFSDAEGANVIADVTIPALGHKSTGENVATCQHKAKCDVCGVEYGEVLAHKLTKVAAKEPTCKDTGNTEYWVCDNCGTLFADAKGTKEVTLDDVTLPVDENAHDYEWVSESEGAIDSKIYVNTYKCTVCDAVAYDAYVLFSVDMKVLKDENSKREVPKNVAFTVDVVNEEDTTPARFVTDGGDEEMEGSWTHLCGGFHATPEAAIAQLKQELSVSKTMKQTTAKKSGWTLDDSEYVVSFVFDENDDTAYTLDIKKNGEDADSVIFVNTYCKKTSGAGFKDPDNVYGDLMDDGKINGSNKGNTTKSDGKTVNSVKTFDAGIGLYVGLSILSLTGSAVVIGKKKVR